MRGRRRGRRMGSMEEEVQDSETTPPVMKINHDSTSSYCDCIL